MDNICHTLVGAALAEAGLKRKTALAPATLMIAANFPDIDVLAVPLGHSLGFRRGITHGVPAQVILPFVLAALVLLWHRWWGRGPAPDARWLVILSFLGILSHPFLDWMNTYGMRWLMPLDPSWSYADTLFIVDPWIWLALGLGVWRSRRPGGTVLPARIALGSVAAYLGFMGGASLVLREAAHEALAARGIAAEAVVVDPVFANPARRRVIYRWEGSYHLATISLPARTLSPPWHAIALNDEHPAVIAARQTAVAREYYSWSRLPYHVIEERADSVIVSVGDARYTLDGRSSWAAVRIAVPRSTITGLAACGAAGPGRKACAP